MRYFAPEDCVAPKPQPADDRHRYVTIAGKLCHIQRVTEPCRRHWWQFWLPRFRDQEYLVEVFTGRMTPFITPRKEPTR